MAKNNNKKKHSNAEKPISLKLLKFDEAVSDLLKVKPEDKKTKTVNRQQKWHRLWA